MGQTDCKDCFAFKGYSISRIKKFYRMEIMEDKDEGGFVVSFPELPGCISCGETVNEALKNAEDAKHEPILCLSSF